MDDESILLPKIGDGYVDDLPQEESDVFLKFSSINLEGEEVHHDNQIPVALANELNQFVKNRLNKSGEIVSRRLGGLVFHFKMYEGYNYKELNFKEFNPNFYQNNKLNTKEDGCEQLENSVEELVKDLIIKQGQTWKSVAEHLGISQKKLRQLVNKSTNLSLVQFQKNIQLRMACSLLENKSQMKIGSISLKVGFRDTRYFSRVFKKEFGINPSDYRQLKIFPEKLNKLNAS